MTDRTFKAALTLTLALIFFNFQLWNWSQIQGVWYLADALMVALPVLYYLTDRESASKGLLLLLAVPAAGVLYMTSQGMLAVEEPSPIWHSVDTFALVLYGYLLGRDMTGKV